MEKNWTYNGVEYTLKRASGYGQYILNGYHFTDSTVWDDVDSEEDDDARLLAMKCAEAFVKAHDY